MNHFVASLAVVGLAAPLLGLTSSLVQAQESDTQTTTIPYRDPGDQGQDDDKMPGVGTLMWGPCDDPTLIEFGAECALLSVPLDHSKPLGTKIQLALSRVVHSVPDDEYQGIMLVNPGGPGGSGLVFSVLGAFVPHGVGNYYDWIGFDPRGVGDSVPSLSCIPDYFTGPRPDYVVTNGFDLERMWLERSADYSAACDANGGELLDHVKTTDTVEDMNAICQALGEEQINYYGFSYGTYLGQVFATLHPDRVRRMVLDSNVDPGEVWYDANIDQDYAFEVVFQLFFDWVAGYDVVYSLGTTAAEVETAFYAAQDELRASPAETLGPAEWTDAFLPAGYVQDYWPDVAAAFAAMVNDGDPIPATTLYESFNDTQNDNGFAIYLATECTDARWPRRYLRWRSDAIQVSQQAPFLTWDNTWFNAPCLTWPARSARPVYVQDTGVPPILLVGETLDAATPFSGSIEVRERFLSSVLIATDGGTNHAYSLFGNACVDNRISAYLRTGRLPPRLPGQGPDVVCDPFPEPEPEAANIGANTATLLAKLHKELQKSIVARNRN
jgi:pimeloyl-ACP methyl ester carboxylesterase